MPIAQQLMDALTNRYGQGRGKQVYYAMQAEGSGPFAPGGAFRKLHEQWAEENGVPYSHATRTKKPRGRRPGTGHGARGHSFKRKHRR